MLSGQNVSTDHCCSVAGTMRRMEPMLDNIVSDALLVVFQNAASTGVLSCIYWYSIEQNEAERVRIEGRRTVV